MGMQLLEAAKIAGISLLFQCVIRWSGFNQPPENEQEDLFPKILKITMTYLRKLNLLRKSIQSTFRGIHSIRAVHQENIIQINEFNNNVHPFHLHIRAKKGSR